MNVMCEFGAIVVFGLKDQWVQVSAHFLNANLKAKLLKVVIEVSANSVPF